jgi:DNA-binding transcriptional MerR regulator
MKTRTYEIVLRRDRRQLRLDALAGRAGIHPSLVERYCELRLIEPMEWSGSNPLFDVSVIPRLRMIERLRWELGINIAGVEVILSMLEHLRALESENRRLRGRL